MRQFSPDAVDLSPDRVYDILSHSYRRHALRVLYERDGSVDVDEMAAQVAARTRDASVSDVDETTRDSVLVELHHNHVPRLRSAGLVDYDPGASSAVELVGDIEPLLPTLRSGGEELREYRLD